METESDSDHVFVRSDMRVDTDRSDMTTTDTDMMFELLANPGKMIVPESRRSSYQKNNEKVPMKPDHYHRQPDPTNTVSDPGRYNNLRTQIPSGSIANFDSSETDHYETLRVADLNSIQLLKVIVSRGKKHYNPAMVAGGTKLLRQLNMEVIHPPRQFRPSTEDRRHRKRGGKRSGNKGGGGRTRR